MLMFDPQYIRPDDIGTQRNKALLLSQTDTMQAVDPVTHRPGDKSGSHAVPVVANDRRRQHTRDRRHNDRRQHDLPCLLDTRSNRERRFQFRRQYDTAQLRPRRAINPPRMGIDEVT